jgi:diguanylate cyclase (GGDEF)-like protein
MTERPVNAGHQAKDTIQSKAIVLVSALLILMFIVVVAFTIKNNNELMEILAENVESELIASSLAARDLIDPKLFDELNSNADVTAHQAAFDETTAKLRALRDEMGAAYIYALKQINGDFYFVFDTDEEDPSVFGNPYTVFEVHKRAFLGDNSATVMAGSDDWGSWNTGAVPLYKDGTIIGIVSTDIEDLYIQRSLDTSFMNTVILSVAIIVVLGALLGTIIALLRRVRKMQDKLYTIANYDNITGLPNRHYLFNYLGELSARDAENESPFAFMFVDLDNFKRVNDSAGHDAGDELLRHIAIFLENSREQDVKAFRPTAGPLALSARIGGDEFLRIVPGIKDKTEATIAAQRLLDSFKAQQHIQSFIEKYQVGLSIGVALFPKNSTNYNTLITYADIAMYHAKAAGKNRYAIFTNDMEQNIDELELSVRRDERC